MNNYKWNNFGTLTSVSKSGNMVLIKNSDNKVLKMSLTKYKNTAIAVYEKAQTMVGKSVTVRTSQNTNNWDTNKWFSEIKLG